MTIQFDTLTFAKRLTAAGEKVEVAEAHAMALREFVMDTIATKADVTALAAKVDGQGTELRAETHAEFGKVRAEMGDLRTEMRTEFGKVRAEIGDLRTEVRTEFGKVRAEMGDLRTELKFDIAASEERMRQELRQATTSLQYDISGVRTDVNTLWLKLTISMGGMMLVTGAGLLFGLLRLLPR